MALVQQRLDEFQHALAADFGGIRATAQQMRQMIDMPPPSDTQSGPNRMEEKIRGRVEEAAETVDELAVVMKETLTVSDVSAIIANLLAANAASLQRITHPDGSKIPAPAIAHARGVSPEASPTSAIPSPVSFPAGAPPSGPASLAPVTPKAATAAAAAAQASHRGNAPASAFRTPGSRTAALAASVGLDGTPATPTLDDIGISAASMAMLGRSIGAELDSTAPAPPPRQPVFARNLAHDSAAAAATAPALAPAPSRRAAATRPSRIPTPSPPPEDRPFSSTVSRPAPRTRPALCSPPSDAPTTGTSGSVFDLPSTPTLSAPITSSIAAPKPAPVAAPAVAAPAPAPAVAAPAPAPASAPEERDYPEGMAVLSPVEAARFESVPSYLRKQISLELLNSTLVGINDFLADKVDAGDASVFFTQTEVLELGIKRPQMKAMLLVLLHLKVVSSRKVGTDTQYSVRA